MKKFLKEFKEFALKGSFLELAVAVVLGAAFKEVVDKIVEVILNPIIAAIQNGMGGASYNAGSAVVIAIIEVIFVIIKFLIVALVLFIIVKAYNKAKTLRKKEEGPADPTVKKCPYCQSEIDIKATRCPHCTSELQ